MGFVQVINIILVGIPRIYIFNLYIFLDISIEEILQHEKWFKKYLELKEKKKKAIENWKLSKKEETKKEESKKQEKPAMKVTNPQQDAAAKMLVQEKLLNWKVCEQKF